MKRFTHSLLAGPFLLGLLVWLSSLPAPVLPAGLIYRHVTTDEPLSVHVLQVDPQQWSISAERAGSGGIGRERVSSIAARTGAAAAINGGFFRLGGKYSGEPSGILKIGSNWFSDPSLPRAAIGWSNGGKVAVLGRPLMDWKVEIGRHILAIDGVNRPRGRGEAILYTASFHQRTLTSPEGREILIAEDRVSEVRHSGDSVIPENGFVVSLGPKFQTDLPEVTHGMEAKAVYSFQDPISENNTAVAWDEMEYIVGGTPLLLTDGLIRSDYQDERVREDFIHERHPRTAIGIRGDGHWVLVVVDGRRPSLSLGMTVPQLSELMKSLQCRQALNLDGGGSSTFFLQNKVLNTPSDLTGERPVSDAILVLKRPQG